MLIDFSKYSSVKIGSTCQVAVLSEMLENDYLIIGAASNLLVNKPRNLAILDDKFDYIKQEGDFLEVGAKTPAYKLFAYSKKHNLGGFEFLCHLPGQMGGVVKMNAGLKSTEISQLIDCVNINGSWQKPEFAYRKSNINGTIYKIRLKINGVFSEELTKHFVAMRNNQPKGASFGSIFKNPANASAGALIDAAGLKGKVKGGAKISDQHGNFLINFNKASFNDAIYLINLAKDEVNKRFGILLEEEVVILK